MRPAGRVKGNGALAEALEARHGQAPCDPRRGHLLDRLRRPGRVALMSGPSASTRSTTSAARAGLILTNCAARISLGLRASSTRAMERLTGSAECCLGRSGQEVAYDRGFRTARL